MAIEQMNISLSPQMARFIRGKVKNGEYTNMSEVVRDAVRRMQESEVKNNTRTWLTDFESSLTKDERESIRRGMLQGIKDIEEGRYEVRVVTGILETIIKVSSQLRAGAPAEQFGEDVRKFAAGKYIIHYRLRAAKSIEILHVFHGVRDQEKSWQGGEGKPR